MEARTCPLCLRIRQMCDCQEHSRRVIDRFETLISDQQVTIADQRVGLQGVMEELQKATQREVTLGAALDAVAHAIGAKGENLEVLTIVLRERLREARAFRELVAGGCPHACAAPCSFHRRVEQVHRG